MANRHNHNTWGAVKRFVNVPLCKTTFDEAQSITAKSVKNWNSLRNQVVFEFSQEQDTTKLI